MGKTLFLMFYKQTTQSIWIIFVSKIGLIIHLHLKAVHTNLKKDNLDVLGLSYNDKKQLRKPYFTRIALKLKIKLHPIRLEYHSRSKNFYFYYGLGVGYNVKLLKKMKFERKFVPVTCTIYLYYFTAGLSC